MKATQGSKLTRNQRRKMEYAALADKGSRHQEQLDGPMVGHFEIVTAESFYDINPKTGALVERVRKVKPYQRIVHDGGEKSTQTTETVKRDTNAHKRRRQFAAWERCATKRETGAHEIVATNCRCCGAPLAYATAGTTQS